MGINSHCSSLPRSEWGVHHFPKAELCLKVLTLTQSSKWQEVDFGIVYRFSVE